jgi:antirestriction protein ArdC
MVNVPPAQEKGWQVRQGEKGTAIEYWEFPDRSKSRTTEPSSDDGPSDSKQPRRMIHRVYTVFNAKQIDGIPPPEEILQKPLKVLHYLLDEIGLDWTLWE